MFLKDYLGYGNVRKHDPNYLLNVLWIQCLMHEEIIFRKGCSEHETERRVASEMWSHSWCVGVLGFGEAGEWYPEGQSLVRRKVLCNKYKTCRKGIKRQLCQRTGKQESWERWAKTSNGAWCRWACSLWHPVWVSGLGSEDGFLKSHFKEL